MNKLVLGLLLLLPSLALGQVTYGAAGTGTGVTATTCTPGVPAGLTTNSISIAVAHSRTNTAHTCTANCGSWAEFSTQAGDATGGRLSVWWVRGTYASAPTFGGPATESYACRIWRFEGAVVSGNPWDLLGTNSAESAASATFTGNSLSPTTVNNVMLVYVGGSMDNNTWGVVGGGIDTPSTTDANFYVANGAGTDNSIFLGYKNAPSNTAPATLTAPTDTQQSLSADAGRSFEFALKPEPITCTGTYNKGNGFFGCL